MEDILADLGANARSEQAIREELREKIGESAGTLYNSASSVAEGDVFGIAADSEVVQSLTLVGDSSDPVEEGNEIDEALANVLRREAEIVNDRLARRRNKLNHINNSISIDSSSLIANTGVVIKEEPYTTVDSNISETAVSGNGTTTVSPPSDIAADRDDGRLAKTNQSIKKSASRVSRINGRQNKQSKVIAEETSRLDASGLTCPICNESFPYADKVNPEVLMSRHVDRCMRRQATEVSTSRKRSRSEPSSRFASEEILRQFDSDASDEESKESVELLDPKDVYKANSSREDQSDDSDEAGEQELMDSDDENVLRTTRNSTAATVSRRRKSNHVHRNRESHSIELNDSDSDRPPVLIEIGDIKDDWEDQDYLARIDPYLEASRTVVELTTDDGLVVDQECWESLYDYQREGCIWLHNLYQDGLGGILGDEMGLGKTAQLCVHFSNLAKGIRSDPYQKKSAALLIVCPATVMNHWLREMNRWAPEMRTVIVHKISMIGGELSRMGDATLGVAIERLQRSRNTRGLTVITTYEGLRKHRGVLGLLEWTAVCLDEGQKIRNPETEITAVCKSIPAYHRVILSGTPIQNNLKELWSLFDFIYPGRLGSLQIFDTEFASPIRMGGYSNASKLQSEIAVRSAAVLQRIVRPYLLRRKKEDLISVTKLPPKTEQVLFCRISPKQRAMYLEVLDSPEIQQVLMRKLTAFRAINVLRKLCNHPALIENDGKVVWHSDYNRDRNIDDDDRDEEAIVRDNLGRISWADSGKMLVLSKVLPLWYSEGHKVLLFTQTRVMLDLVESMIRELGFKHLRLDGNTPIHKRAGIIERFNKDPSIFIILLTSRTGGVGVSLTAANRVVLYDPGTLCRFKLSLVLS